jgi:hypothetical protein
MRDLRQRPDSDSPDGARHVIHPALGSGVWYCDLPDGRTTYSNGLIHGVTDGRAGVERSVALPESLGLPDQCFGALHPGQYRYTLSFVRLADRLEGPAISSEPLMLAQGGLRLDGLPELEGHAVNVYLSGKDGEGAYLAGTALGPSFEFTGDNTALVLPCRTLGPSPSRWERSQPSGAGGCWWRRAMCCGLRAPWRPTWQTGATSSALAAPITAIVPVEDGVYVGTEQDLVFLAGTEWEQLAYVPTKRGPVVLGSGVRRPGTASSWAMARAAARPCCALQGARWWPVLPVARPPA